VTGSDRRRGAAPPLALMPDTGLGGNAARGRAGVSRILVAQDRDQEIRSASSWRSSRRTRSSPRPAQSGARGRLIPFPGVVLAMTDTFQALNRLFRERILVLDGRWDDGSVRTGRREPSSAAPGSPIIRASKGCNDLPRSHVLRSSTRSTQVPGRRGGHHRDQHVQRPGDLARRLRLEGFAYEMNKTAALPPGTAVGAIRDGREPGKPRSSRGLDGRPTAPLAVPDVGTTAFARSLR